ncbi:MAG TPA: right-handed parallel beta-helix repeat-containing protein [Candidatus Binatia bacterium]|jgi:hypothetical protein|nr:right-handed parallel beta-helix repeat-containing protein [Candidatus Binatia bacterium]
MGRGRDLAVGIVCAALLVGVGSAASAAVIQVPADQPSIQAAVDAAVAGDVVRIAPGVYAEKVRIAGARDGLTLEAADPADPPLILGNPSTSTDGIQVEQVDGVILRALRVEGANVGVRLTRVDGAMLESLRLVNDDLGIRMIGGRGNTIRATAIAGTRGRQGILVESSPAATVEEVLIDAPEREGISIRNSPGGVLLRVGVHASQGSDGIRVYRSKGTRIEEATTTANARNGLRASSSLDLVLARSVADDNGSAGFRIERSSPFDDVDDVLALGNTARDNDGRDIVVEPFRCNQQHCPTTTTVSFTTTTTSSTSTSTTVVGPTTTSTTIPSPPLAEASWRLYVRIDTGAPFPHNVDVPLHSTEVPLDVMIRADHLAAFRPGDQVTGDELAQLGGDTLVRLTAAVDAYLRSHPTDYPDLTGIVEIRWAKRVVP